MLPVHRFFFKSMSLYAKQARKSMHGVQEGGWSIPIFSFPQPHPLALEVNKSTTVLLIFTRTLNDL